MTVSPRSAALLLLGAATVIAIPAAAPARLPAGQMPSSPAPAPAPAEQAYADLADLLAVAPVVADATIRSTALVKPAEAPGLAPGRTRYYVEADIAALLKGPEGTSARIGYLLDVSPDAMGKLPRLKKRRVLVFARPVPETPGQLQLVAPDAQVDWTPSIDARVRGIGQAMVAPDAPPRITGVGNAFHVPGALPGEGETQIFLTTANGAPVSLSVLRRPGEQPRWAVALSEIVDEAAAPPPRDSLLWYRLACTLPAALPGRSTASLETADAAAAREDYAFVLAALGACGRSRQSG